MLGTVFALLVGACASTPEPPPVDAKPPTYAEQIEELRQRLEQVTGITDLMQLPDNKQAIEA